MHFDIVTMLYMVGFSLPVAFVIVFAICWSLRVPRECRIVAVPLIMRSHCRGVMIGACIEGSGCEREDREGHFAVESGVRAAHAHVEGDYAGWVCFRNWYYFRNASLRLHELAHLISPPTQDDGNHHGSQWQATFHDLKRNYRRVLQ